MNNSFSSKTLIKKSFQIVKNNLKSFILLLLIIWLIQLITSSLGNIFQNQFLSLILTILSWVINALVSIGLINISLKFINQEKYSLSNLIEKTHKIKPYIIGTIYYSLIVFAGLILLIIPGIIWAIRYQFYSYLIIDKNMPPKKALAKSKKITEGETLKLIGLGLLIILINILGLLAFGVGLLITIPTGMLAITMAYKKLLNKDDPNSVKPNQPQPNTSNLWATYRQNR